MLLSELNHWLQSLSCVYFDYVDAGDSDGYRFSDAWWQSLHRELSERMPPIIPQMKRASFDPGARAV